MGTLNPQTLISKLERLNATQQSIESVSQYCIFYRKESKKVVATWEQEFAKAPFNRKLAMFYLVNDILQNSRKKGPEFVNEFFRVIPKSLRHLCKHGDEKTKSAIQRTLAVWDERKVFGTSGMKALKAELAEDAGTPKRPSSGSGRSEAPAVDVGKHAAVAGLAHALQAVAEASSRAGTLAEGASAVQEQVETSSSTQLATAQTRLTDYDNALDAELAARQRAITTLNQLLAEQNRFLVKAQEDKQACQELLQRVQSKQAQLPTSTNGTSHDTVMEDQVAAALEPPPYEPAEADPWNVYGSALADEGVVLAAAASFGGAMDYNGAQPPSGTEAAAALLAAQLTSSGESAQALMDALAALSPEQQAQIGMNMANVLQGGQSGDIGQQAVDEYNPEDAFY